jgi:hypothetical protein
MISSIDPITAGFVASLSHSGGNITGISQQQRELSAIKIPRIGFLAGGGDAVMFARASNHSEKDYRIAAMLKKKHILVEDRYIEKNVSEFSSLVAGGVGTFGDEATVIRSPKLSWRKF